MSRGYGLHRASYGLRKRYEGDEILRHAARHVRTDRQALALIAQLMLGIPVFRDPEQVIALQRIIEKAETERKSWA
jgi:hypothetical protein